MDLKKNGYCILKNVFSKKLTDDLNLKFQTQIKNLNNISIPRDLRKQKKNIESIYSSKIDKDIFISG